MSSTVPKYKTYKIQTNEIKLNTTVVDTKLAKEGFIKLLRSLGFSPVSDVTMRVEYYPERDCYKTYLNVRYVDIPNVNFKVQDNVNVITVSVEEEIL